MQYSKELHIIVPIDYQANGCVVYGGSWIDASKLQDDDIHLFRENGKPIKTQYGYKLCIGTPESFAMMKNVILESVRTADNLLVAYERIMTGKARKLDLIAYAHGNAGRIQFLLNNRRYITKG